MYLEERKRKRRERERKKREKNDDEAEQELKILERIIREKKRVPRHFYSLIFILEFIPSYFILHHTLLQIVFQRATTKFTTDPVNITPLGRTIYLCFVQVYIM